VKSRLYGETQKDCFENLKGQTGVADSSTVIGLSFIKDKEFLAQLRISLSA
jgi:hypothetical protein